MKLRYLLILLLVAACDRPQQQPRDQRPKENKHSDTAYVDFYETEKNVHDRDYGTSAGDQPDNAVDRIITENIHLALIADDTLSKDAQQTRITTVNRNVTLRGVVDSNAEEGYVIQIAKNINGVNHVKSLLHVKLDR